MQDHAEVSALESRLEIELESVDEAAQDFLSQLESPVRCRFNKGAAVLAIQLLAPAFVRPERLMKPQRREVRLEQPLAVDDDLDVHADDREVIARQVDDRSADVDPARFFSSAPHRNDVAGVGPHRKRDGLAERGNEVRVEAGPLHR